MSTSWRWMIGIIGHVKLGESLRGDIKAPEVAKLIVLVVLTSKDVHFAIMNRSTMTGSNAWSSWAVLTNLLPLEDVVLLGAYKAFVGS